MAKSKRKRKSKVTLQKAGSIISISTLNLKMELEEEEERSGPGRIKFISLNFIADLYRQRNPSKLTLSLENDLRTIAREGEEWWVEDLKIERIAKDWQIRGIKIEELEEYVRTQASKLYALLLLLHQSQVIIPLYKQEHRVTDSIFDQSDVEGDEPYCLMEFLQTHNQLSRFAVKFFEAQWRIPSRLCRDTVPTFPPATFHFPYVGELESIARGAYGEVFKVKVAVGHLIGDAKHGYVTVSRQSNAGYEYQLKYRQGSVVAHKQIEKKKHMTEELVMQEVNTIRAREHPNIVKFLAAFSAGRLLPWRPNDATKCLHMLFEHTSAGTMQDWLDRDDPPELLADVSTRRRHVKKSVEKLVEAVAWIHKKIGGYSAYHHDLKPSNILRFEGPPATWKICDFGMANLKRPDDNSGTTHRFDNVFGSYIYQPPEYFSSDQSFSHGRPFDVWSLGCIILELLTVWKHGWGKISCREFYKERGANTNLLSYNRWYQRQSASEDHSYHNNPTVVKDWMSRLREEEGADADPWFCHSLGLVEEMLAEKEMRVFIWEVHMDLYEMAHPVLKDRQLKEYFRSVVQASDTPLNNLSRSHNPLKRAKEHGKHWQEQVLRDEAWSVDSPDPTPQLKLRRHDTGWKFSTLSACSNAEEFTRDKLYGRHAIDAMIAEGFRNSNLVGLYGMSGVGKSHLAYNHIERFRSAESYQDQMHTFWVDASSQRKFTETVSRIAKDICLVVPKPDDLCRIVKEWLSNATNGQWFMVVDDLNQHEVVTKLVQLVPKDSGQVLVTTKNWSMLDQLEESFISDQRGTYVHVDHLRIDDLLLIFERHNDNVIPMNPQMNDLLESLCLPAIVKSTAKWAKKNKTPNSKLHGIIVKRRHALVSVQLPNAVYIEFTRAHKLFQPIDCVNGANASPKWPSPAALLLGTLSCLQHDKMDLQLIKNGYSREDQLREMLGLLENCSFIIKDTIINIERYTMHSTIQELMRSWVLQNMGLSSLLALYQTVLCMLVLQYKAKKNGGESINGQRSSYLQKLPFMTHFDRYLGFAKEYAIELVALPKAEFTCIDRMVYSVITFARVYLDEGRYDDAAWVLHLTWRFYQGTRYRAPLARQLCEAYTLPPLVSRDKAKWNEITALLKEVVEAIKKMPTSDHEQEWLCLLSLANIYSKILQPVQASRILVRLRDINLVVQCGQPILKVKKDAKFEQSNGLAKLAIHKCVAEARIQAAKAKGALDSKARAKYLQQALYLLGQARLAVSKWYKISDKWASELDEDIADIWCTMDDSDFAKKAVAMYKMLLKGLQAEPPTPERPWSQVRIWDMKCKVAYTQLKLRPLCSTLNTQEAFHTLKRALVFYEQVYGRRDGKHDEHTRVCAYLLAEVYEDRDMIPQAEQVASKYSFETVDWQNARSFIVEDYSWGARLFASCVSLFLVVAFISITVSS